MPPNIVTVLKKYCGTEGYRPMDMNRTSVKDERRFFLTELPKDEQQAMIDFFSKVKDQIVNVVFRGEKPPYADYMLVTQPGLANSAIVDMKKVMMYYSGSAHITKRGNLKLGKITVQRKGGNGGGPTQMLQFKFSPKHVFDIARKKK